MYLYHVVIRTSYMPADLVWSIHILTSSENIFACSLDTLTVANTWLMVNRYKLGVY